MNKVLLMSMAVALVLLPAIAAFTIGYGIAARIIGPLVFALIGATIALTVYSLYALLRCMFLLLWKKDRSYVLRLAYSASVLVMLIVVFYSFPQIVRYGATVRVNFAGGEDFAERLIEDATSLLESTRGSRVTRLDLEDMPPSFLALGGDSTLIFHEDVSYVEIISSGRPIRTGWIIIPNEDYSIPKDGVLRVFDHIYRYH